MAVYAVVAFAGATLISGEWKTELVVICASAVVVTALCVHVPRGIPPWMALLLSVAAGLCTAVIVSLAAVPVALAALPLALLALPGRWIVSRGYAIIPKILSGWMIAIAILAAALPLITTPGYQPDHME